MWWLQPGWTDAICPRCGKKIWPEGDPDWGMCYDCLNFDINRRRQEEEMMYPCDICGKNTAVAGANGYGICSQECENEAMQREPR